MRRWHSGTTDPVFLVADYYVNDRVYPNQVMVVAARDYLQASIQSLKEARDQRHPVLVDAMQELHVLVFELDLLLKRDYPTRH